MEPTFEIFLFRISSQIWKFSPKLRFSHFSFGLIFKRISSQKRQALHVLCANHLCASFARTVLKPLSFLLWVSGVKWSEVKWVKWANFGSCIFTRGGTSMVVFEKKKRGCYRYGKFPKCINFQNICNSQLPLKLLRLY